MSVAGSRIFKYFMLVKVKVYPCSKEEGVTKLAEDKYEVKVNEKPEMNLANDRARQLLAVYFGLLESKVRLIHGGHTQNKIFEIADLN
jgi:uncharacterized protein YggU (UPF0235/DUF167 family)